MPAVQDTIDRVRKIDVDQYKYGFETEIETDKAPKGLNEDIIRLISAKKNEPEWMLEWRLSAYRRWLTLEEPTWARVEYPRIDFQDIHYYAAPRASPARSRSTRSIRSCCGLREARHPAQGAGDPCRVKKAAPAEGGEELEAGSDNVYKSGRVAVDAVFDSVSVVTTFKEELAKAGVIFCSISEAIREHPSW